MSVLSEQVDGRPPQPPSGRRGKRWLRAIAAGALLAAGVGASTQPVAQQAPQSHARKVKVLIISMFAPEAQPWIDKLGLTQAVPVPGLSIDYPSVHCNASDVCQLTTGMGKANAASSVSALIHSGQFDLSRAYFLVAGIAGIDPSQGTLGTAAWARYLVDSDLAWEIDAREVPADWPNGFIGINTQGPGQKPPLNYKTEIFRVNEALLQKALALSKGAAGQSDTLQARTAFAKAQLAEQRAVADFRKALSALAYALGLQPGTAFQLAELNDATDSQSVGELARWLDEAAARHPGIASARAQWDAANARVAKTRAEGLPTIDLTANFYQNGYPNQGLQSTRNNVSTVGLTLTIPLFEGFARTYKIRGAEAQAEQSEAQYEDTKNQILSDVIKVHADAVAAVDNLRASDVLIRSAQASMVSSEKRYAKGAADVLELLSTQSALMDAMQERVRCLSEWRAARLRLMATAGVLGRERLDNPLVR
ncbi:TolC family protein [Ralstonia pseudosolanacearum]|uniref:TolC family protein n=1 Tax=Ralstonia pseudosolanacearum TaxID=1310165 RepID=UPI003D17EB54